MRKTKTIQGVQFHEIDVSAYIEKGQPCIFKGALNDCPLVIEGKRSDDAAMSHLLAFDAKRPHLYYLADAEAKTRFFYAKAMDGFNYTTAYAPLGEFFQQLDDEKKAATGKSFYIGSADLAGHFPELMANDGLSLNGEISEKHEAFTGIWLGNRTTAATHYDVSNNIAACMVGRRRFTLFPPDQIANLYPGPLEPTPGGQVVSMVDLDAPDLEAFPRFSKALETAEVAELEAGDVLVYPAMWWHQVQALSDFNVLINYWWNTTPAFVDDPFNTLLHGLLSLRDRPDNEKMAWRSLFDYYVFGDANQPRNHLPSHVWGALGELDPSSARRLRTKILKKINR